jgi:hypothetical protein
MGGTSLIGLKTQPKPGSLDCLAKDTGGAIWHFWVYQQDIITDPVPKFVRLGSDRTASTPGDVFFKSKRTYSVWNKQKIEDYLAFLNRVRIREQKEAREEEQFEKYAKTAEFFVNLAGLFVPILGGVSLACRFWLVKTALEAVKICVKSEVTGLSGGDIVESLQTLLLDEWLFAEYKVVCPAGLRGAVEMTEKGYKVYEPYEQARNAVEFAQAYGPPKRRPATSVDGDLARIHRFRYMMDANYASQYDATERMFRQWRQNNAASLTPGVKVAQPGR